MQKIVAIITEYNPFHLGHQYQIDRIKELEPNSTIIAIMSGNIVQRGEFAMLDKYTRAKMAVECGVDAVFELPYPYSGSTAELFAYGGVKLANDLGANVLYFGSESDDVEWLTEIAKVLASEKFEKELKIQIADDTLSYIQKREIAMANLGYKMPTLSNDILAVEYIKQIIVNSYDIEYKSIKRIGANYNDREKNEIMSATGIRDAYYSTSQAISMPKKALTIFSEANENGKVLDLEKANDILYYFTLLSNPKEIEKAFDAPSGIGYLLNTRARECENSLEFISSLSTKNLTSARIKRTLLYSLFKVKKAFKINKSFTILLSANKKGISVIKNTNKKHVTIITKHADRKELNKSQNKNYEILKRVDEVYQTLLKMPNSVTFAYKTIPYLKK